jgi:hypothetical protein
LGLNRLAVSLSGADWTFIAFLLSSQPQYDVFAFNGYIEQPEPLARVRLKLAVVQTPVPMVPGATHDSFPAEHFPLAERSPLVRASVRSRENFRPDAKDRHGSAACLDRDASPFGKIGELADDIFLHVASFALKFETYVFFQTFLARSSFFVQM